MRWLVCAAAWLLAPLAGLFVAATTKWGPILWQLSQNHGVHLGDVVALAAGVAVAVAVTVAAFWRPVGGDTAGSADDLVPPADPVPAEPAPSDASPTHL
jgi:hypothetical protein